MSFYLLQRGYIDGPVLSTFYTNLVVLPAVMEYMQYGFIALGLVTIVIAAFVHYKVKVKLPSRSPSDLCYVFVFFLTVCCTTPHVVPLTDAKWSKRDCTEDTLICS